MEALEKSNVERLRKHLSECMVLLKTDGSFPLAEPCLIAAYGAGVRHTVKGGTGSGEVNSRYWVTVEQGLKEHGFTITSGKWLDSYDEILEKAEEDFKAEVRARARKKHTLALLEGMGMTMTVPDYEIPLDADGDAAIYVLSRNSGEGSDRRAEKGDFLLTDTERREILAINQKYDKFMLVLNVGGPVDLSGLEEVKNILVLSQLGVETGNALADVLLGKYSPSGKLTTTWSKWEDYSHEGSFGEQDETRYKEGIYVGYRYFDSIGRKALYPFGHGLSYASFKIDNEVIKINGSEVAVSADVHNTGKHAGKETVQIYVCCPEGKLNRAYQELAGFAKTGELKPGESETVSVTFNMNDLAGYDEQTSSFILEKGDYIVRCGNSSVNTKALSALRLGEDITVKKAEAKLGKPDFRDLIIDREQVNEAVPVILLDVKDFVTETVRYEDKYVSDPVIEKLSEEALIRLNIGEYGSNPLSIVGNASKSVAGAAGESTNIALAQGVRNLVMADGPAGLRLSPQFYRDEKGVHSLAAPFPESMMTFAPKLLLKLIIPKAKKGVKVEEQYTTAIPIATAIAQSWNRELAYECGDIVGSEMEKFGVQLWLAPALNIHRNVLCGRNFEYYSEDPLVSGIMAAAVTKGVQSHKGCGVTLKHYAANNQETNRMNNNSLVSERAMREIYLRGFEIAVKQAQPKAVMNSYNLINGVHTSESRELCHDLLRCEFGFKGIVMTDWVIGTGLMSKNAKYMPPNAAKVAHAGTNLFMPGSKGEFKQIKKGLTEGTVTREELVHNATETYRMVNELRK